MMYFGLSLIIIVISLVAIGVNKFLIDSTGKPLSDVYSYQKWLNLPTERHVSFYLFNLMNPEAFEKRGAKPEFLEIGPFVFKEIRLKENLTNNKNGTITYKEKKVFHFVPNMSPFPKEMIITTINLPALALINHAQFNEKMKHFVNRVFRYYDESIIIKKTAEELLFGYESKLLSVFESKFFSNGSNLIFYQKNNSIIGEFTVLSGKENKNKRGVIQNLNEMNKLPFRSSDYLNNKNGTISSLSHPLLNETSMPLIYYNEFCRFTPLIYQETKNLLNNLKVLGFTLDPDFYNNVGIRLENESFCTTSNSNDCLISGVLNVTNCYSVGILNAPLYISHPHFLFGNSKLLKDVVGLKPNLTEHRTIAYFEPNSGIETHSNIRIQLNAKLNQDNSFILSKKFSNFYFPLMWSDQETVLNKKDFPKFWITLKCLDFFGYSLITILLLTSMLFLLDYFYSKNKNTNFEKEKSNENKTVVESNLTEDAWSYIKSKKKQVYESYIQNVQKFDNSKIEKNDNSVIDLTEIPKTKQNASFEYILNMKNVYLPKINEFVSFLKHKFYDIYNFSIQKNFDQNDKENESINITQFDQPEIELKLNEPLNLIDYTEILEPVLEKKIDSEISHSFSIKKIVPNSSFFGNKNDHAITKIQSMLVKNKIVGDESLNDMKKTSINSDSLSSNNINLDSNRFNQKSNNIQVPIQDSVSNYQPNLNSKTEMEYSINKNLNNLNSQMVNFDGEEVKEHFENKSKIREPPIIVFNYKPKEWISEKKENYILDALPEISLSIQTVNSVSKHSNEFVPKENRQFVSVPVIDDKSKSGIFENKSEIKKKEEPNTDEFESEIVTLIQNYKSYGIHKMDPKIYVEKYGSELINSNEFPDFVTNMKAPSGYSFASDEKENNSYRLVGNIDALNLIDLDKEGLSELKSISSNKNNYSNEKFDRSYNSNIYTTFNKSDFSEGAWSYLKSKKSKVFDYYLVSTDSKNLSFNETSPNKSKELTACIHETNSTSLMKQIEKLFDEIDLKNLGYLTIVEVRKFVLELNRIMGKNYDEIDIQNFFSTLDPKKEGKISKENFKNIFLNLL